MDFELEEDMKKMDEVPRTPKTPPALPSKHPSGLLVGQEKPPRSTTHPGSTQSQKSQESAPSHKTYPEKGKRGTVRYTTFKHILLKDTREETESEVVFQ